MDAVKIEPDEYTEHSAIDPKISLHKPNLTIGPYQCEICKKAFTQNIHLINHKKVHTGDKPYQCDLCDKSFGHNHHLKRHMLTHTGEKPHKCKICEKAFAQSNDLIRHNRIHTGSKPFICDYCEKAFSDKGNLIHHERIHTEEKPFMCDLCKKFFAQKFSLHMHRRTHTGEKPHHCNECGKSFSQNSGLIKHKVIHTGEKPYSCEICQICFSQKVNLTKHNKSVVHMKMVENLNADRSTPLLNRGHLNDVIKSEVDKEYEGCFDYSNYKSVECSKFFPVEFVDIKEEVTEKDDIELKQGVKEELFDKEIDNVQIKVEGGMENEKMSMNIMIKEVL